MSKKRARDNDDSDVVHLKTLVDIQYDRDQIDKLLSYYRAEPSSNCSSVSPSSAEQDMVCCPREYEETFLREPVGTERACVRGQQCEGLAILCDHPFVLREFIYPGKKPSDTCSLCLLCRRDEISRAYYRYETGHAPEKHNLRISDHFNLVGVPGEYDVRDCLVSSTKYSGIPLPVVLHVRSAYSSLTKNGIRHLAQTRMRCPGSCSDQEEGSGSFLMRRAALESKVAPFKN